MANVRIRITTNQAVVTRRLGNITEDTKRRIKQQVFLSATTIEGNAKRKAPIDTGALRASITTRTENQGLTAIIGSNKNYAAFREFGTGRQTKVPSGFEALARQFKGSGGTPPARALRDWARRNGMDGLEFAIARSIGKKGTKPKPFLIPAFKAEQRNFQNKIKRILRNPTT